MENTVNKNEANPSKNSSVFKLIKQSVVLEVKHTSLPLEAGEVIRHYAPKAHKTVRTANHNEPLIAAT